MKPTFITLLALCLCLAVGCGQGPAVAKAKTPLRLDAGIGADGTAPILVLTWSHDGKTLASNGLGAKFNDRGEEEEVRQLLLWDAENWGKNPKDRIKPKNRISANDLGMVANFFQRLEADFFDPNNSNRLALYFSGAQGSYNFGILDLKLLEDKPRFIGHPNGGAVTSAYSAHWSRDGKKIAFNQSVNLYIVDPVNGKTLHTLNARNAREVLSPGHRDFGQVAGWSSDGKYLVTKIKGGGGSGIVVFDAKLEKELFRFVYPARNAKKHLWTITSVAWNPKGTEIAYSVEAPLDRHHLYFLDMKGLGANEDPVGAPSRLKRQDPDRKFLMKDSRGEKIQFGTKLLEWDPQGHRIAVIRNHGEPVIHVYSKEGTLLHELAVKDIFRHPNPKSRGGGGVASLAWSPDGSKIAAGLGDGTIRVFGMPE